VSSPAYSIERSKKSEFTLTLGKRVLLVIVAWCIQMIYIPTSMRPEGGIEPKLPIDIFPVWSIWILPYVLCYALWSVSFVWIVLKTEDRLFRSFVAACMLTFAVGNMIFIFFPTYVMPASLPGNDIFTWLLHMIQKNSGRYDAFPSAHIYITTLLTLFFSRWYPRRKLLWILILVIVSFSTLFTGQHYILDVLGGYAVAFSGYYFGLWWTSFLPSQKRSGKRMPSSSLN
jgi:membrane-associated phospholipid phosphatase